MNQGQTDGSVKFLSRNARYPLFLTADQAVFVLTDVATLSDPTKVTAPVKGDVVRLVNDGANSDVQVTGLDQVPGSTNYMIGKDSRKWQKGIKGYSRVQYSGIYPGIDLVYYGTADGSVEYDYVVAPGADAGVIATNVEGADQVSVDRNGDLSITTGVGTLTERKPAIYQNINGKKKPVSGGYRSLGGNRIGFSLGAHDQSQSVVIDPVLSYSTYLGGNIGQNLGSPGKSIAVDSSGDAYVTGSTFAPDFPTTTGAFQTSKFGDPTSGSFPNTTNAFVTKFSPDGSSLVYSTYLGGTGRGFFAGDIGYGIAVDGAGHAFVTGSTTSDDFPITGNAAQPNRKSTACTTCFNAFVTEFDPSGSSLMYSSYLGGTSGNGGLQEGGRSIAVDSGGDVYVAGLARSFDFPTTPNALQPGCPSECPVSADGVSTSGSPTFTSASAFFESFEAGSPISGTNIPANSCINSVTDVTTVVLGDCNGNPVNATGTGSDLTFTIATRTRVQAGFFARFDPAASGAASLTYSTLIGGGSGQEVSIGGGDAASGVAVDGAGEAYVTGRAASYNFPTTAGALQTTCGDCPIHTDGVTQSGSTDFTSASANFGPFDVGNPIEGVDIATGTTIAAVVSSHEVTLSAPAEAGGSGLKFTGFGGGSAGFVLKLNPAASGAASLVFGTFLGGAGGTEAFRGRFFGGGTFGAGIAVDPSRRTIYVTGTTADFDFPTTFGAFSRTCDGSPPCGSLTTFSDGVTTSGSTALTSATANFQRGKLFDDQGAQIAGPNIAPGTYITSVVNSTTVTLSQPATGTGTADFQMLDRGGSSDQFVTQLDPSGGSLVYSTFLGGAGPQQGAGVAIDVSGDAYVIGSSSWPTFPVKDPVARWGGGRPPDPAGGWPGPDDVTVSELASNGKSLVYATTLGGNSLDEPAGIAVDTAGAAYVTGNTKSPTFPTTPGSVKPLYGGRLNAFVAKVAPVPSALPLVTGLSSTHGPTGGGTTVVISGHGFTGATTVTFGGVAASFHIDSATQITATSPPQATATPQMDVIVRTPGGLSPANPIDRFDAGDGQWTAAQSLSTEREGPTGTLLKNGKVLVVGGDQLIGSDSQIVSASEIYDPVAGTWSPADAPADPRGDGHLATLLNDGRVLVVGRAAAACCDTSAEVYDPATGHWTTVASANADHSAGAAALLTDGRVLVVGGTHATSAEVYDPVANTWTSTAAPVSSGFTLAEPSLTRLNGGRVLLAGGSGGTGFAARSTAELFDPSTNTWSATGSMNVPHLAAASLLLPDGRVLVAGGLQSVGDVEAVTAEETYDPGSGTWALAGLLRTPRSGATATLLPNSKVLITAGLIESVDGQAGPLDTAELFDPAAPLQQGIADDLITARGKATPQVAPHTFAAVLLSSDVSSFKADPAVCGTNCGKVLVVGGSYDNSAELYSPPPVVTGVSPSLGSLSGGTTVTISGTGFSTGTPLTVTFGGTAAQVTSSSYTQITATSPPGSAGTVDVQVSTPAGKSVTSGADHFTYSTLHANGGQYNSSVQYGTQLNDFYYDQSTHALRHSWWNGSSWGSEILDGAGGGNGRVSEDVGQFNSAVVYNGQLNDFYYDAASHVLRHAWWNGSAWSFETLDGGGGGSNGRVAEDVGQFNSTMVYSSQLDDFYYDAASHVLRHAWWNGSGWFFQTLDGSGGGSGQVSEDVGQHSSAIIYNGQLQDFYYDAASHLLRHAWWNGSGWFFQTLDGAGGGSGQVIEDVGQYNSAVLYSGQLQDFYYDATARTLRHSWWNGVGWSAQPLDGAGGGNGQVAEDVGQYSSAIVYNSQLQDFYYDSATHVLRHSWWNGAGWFFETLDGSGGINGRVAEDVGQFSSTIVYFGQLNDFYADNLQHILRHAWWDGSAWFFEFLQ